MTHPSLSVSPEKAENRFNRRYTSHSPYKWTNKLINKKDTIEFNGGVLGNTALLKHSIKYSMNMITTLEYSIPPQKLIDSPNSCCQPLYVLVPSQSVYYPLPPYLNLFVRKNKIYTEVNKTKNPTTIIIIISKIQIIISVAYKCIITMQTR